MERQAPLEVLLHTQAGLASRAQLVAHGITPAALKWRLGRTWRAVLPGVVATFTGNLDAGQHLVAAQLFAGPTAVISSLTAAAWHGVESARGEPVIRLAVPHGLAARRCSGVLVTRTTRPDLAVWERDPLRIASRARAVVDAARDSGSARAASAIVIEAVQRGIVTASSVRHELECGPRNGSAKVRRAVDLAEQGVWSVPEGDLLGAIAISRILPEMWPNPSLTTLDGVRLPTPDGWIDEVGLAIQVHSRAHHLRDDDWNATVSSDSALGELGIVVLGVTPAQLVEDPAAVRLRAERAYLALRNRPRPPVLAVPRSLFTRRSDRL